MLTGEDLGLLAVAEHAPAVVDLQQPELEAGPPFMRRDRHQVARLPVMPQEGRVVQRRDDVPVHDEEGVVETRDEPERPRGSDGLRVVNQRELCAAVPVLKTARISSPDSPRQMLTRRPASRARR